MAQIPHSTTTWVTVRIERGGELKTIFVVETKLELAVDSPKFQPDAYHQMVEAVRDYLTANPSVDAAEIHPV